MPERCTDLSDVVDIRRPLSRPLRKTQSVGFVAPKQDDRLRKSRDVNCHSLSDQQVHQGIVDQLSIRKDRSEPGHVRRDPEACLTMDDGLLVAIPIGGDDRNVAGHRLYRSQPESLLRVIAGSHEDVGRAIEGDLLSITDIGPNDHHIVNPATHQQQLHPLQVRAMRRRPGEDQFPRPA